MIHRPVYPKFPLPGYAVAFLKHCQTNAALEGSRLPDSALLCRMHSAVQVPIV